MSWLMRRRPLACGGLSMASRHEACRGWCADGRWRVAACPWRLGARHVVVDAQTAVGVWRPVHGVSARGMSHRLAAGIQSRPRVLTSGIRRLVRKLNFIPRTTLIICHVSAWINKVFVCRCTYSNNGCIWFV